MAHLPDRTYLRGGGGIASLEAYHAGAVRTLLLQQAAAAPAPFNVSMASVTSVRESGFGSGSGLPPALSVSMTGRDFGVFRCAPGAMAGALYVAGGGPQRSASVMTRMQNLSGQHEADHVRCKQVACKPLRRHGHVGSLAGFLIRHFALSMVSTPLLRAGIAAVGSHRIASDSPRLRVVSAAGFQGGPVEW